MTCKDCIHYKVCKVIDMAGIWGKAELCESFKDAGAIIELPCKVGDTVYKICVSNFAGTKTIKTDRVYKVEIWTDELRISCDNAPGLIYGKSVFLTRTEAEKALEGTK